MGEAEHESDIELTNDTPYLADIECFVARILVKIITDALYSENDNPIDCYITS